MKVAAFNVKNLGMKKVTDKNVLNHLTWIMSRYSIVVLLEVVDNTNTAMNILLGQLNALGTPYSMIASAQLGRHTYKEQFVWFYRTDEVRLESSYQYEDNQAGDEDAFAREPFIVRFTCPSTVVKDLVLIPVHTKPEDAKKELDELYDVVQSVIAKWKTTNIMILGDFNADGRYLSKKNKREIRIYSPPFHWLIDDDVDTTTSNCNDNTYDRIVVCKKKMVDAIVPGSAEAFNFQEEFKLTDREALSISDHYPVEVELKTQAVGQRKKAVPQTTSAKAPTPKRAPTKKATTPKRKKGQSATTSSAAKRSR